jgi:23S rRNA (pseudouridine1915-N3)-methyltransferase
VVNPSETYDPHLDARHLQLATRNLQTAVVKLKLAWIGKTRDKHIQALTDHYLTRISRFAGLDAHELASESALLRMMEKSRTPPVLVLLDARGRQLSSEELADWLKSHQDRATQVLMFAVGPADGFTEQARRAASLQLSLGKMTIAHELARIVLLEQVYRAFTILKGHPYHLGH